MKALNILKRIAHLSNNNVYIYGYQKDDFLEAIAELEALQAPKTCEYKIEDDIYTGTVYHFACGYSYVTIDGDLKDNGVNYCPSCGGEIKETQC